MEFFLSHKGIGRYLWLLLSLFSYQGTEAQIDFRELLKIKVVSWASQAAQW